MSPEVQGVVKADELCDKMKDSLIYCRKKKKKRGKNRESGILAGEEEGVGGGELYFSLSWQNIFFLLLPKMNKCCAENVFLNFFL